MNLDQFERLVRTLARDIPDEYLDGVAAIDVSPRTVAHPVAGDVFTLGECIPMHGDADTITSRIVLYHGSFRALAELRDDFDWRTEAWDTLTHELRHHVEWRANADALEDYDRAADENFARHEGRPFDPLFYLGGDEVAEGIYKVDDDLFLDRRVRRVPADVPFRWRGQAYTVTLAPEKPALPVYVLVDGVPEPPPGDLVLVLRPGARLRDLFRRPAATVVRRTARPDA